MKSRLGKVSLRTALLLRFTYNYSPSFNASSGLLANLTANEISLLLVGTFTGILRFRASKRLFYRGIIYEWKHSNHELSGQVSTDILQNASGVIGALRKFVLSLHLHMLWLRS